MTSFLIVRLGSLGDVVHAIPFAAALRAGFPEARIDWLVDPRYLELVDLVSVVDLRIPADPRDLATRARRRVFLRALSALRRARYDVAFDLQGLVKSAAMARAAGARRLVGFSRGHLREPLARFLYTESIDPGAAAHVIDMNLALLDAVGIPDRRVRFPLAVPPSRVADALRDRFRDGFVLVNPGAAWPNKRWPPARFGAVAAAIERTHGFRSVVLWGPGERALADEVVEASAGAAEVAPPTTIQELAAVARLARLMIAGDTGPLHLAAAVGTPIVALFGPTRPERNGPWAAGDVVVSRVAGCVCLYERRCRRNAPCIEEIGVGEVVDAVARRLAASPSTAGA